MPQFPFHKLTKIQLTFFKEMLNSIAGCHNFSTGAMLRYLSLSFRRKRNIEKIATLDSTYRMCERSKIFIAQ